MAVKSTVTVFEELCKGCGLCVQFCPKQIIKLDDKTNRFGYHPAILTDQDKCNGCGFCYTVCPDIAIQVERGSAND